MLIFGELHLCVSSSQLSTVVLGWELCLLFNFLEFKVCLQVDNKGISIEMASTSISWSTAVSRRSCTV